jgi:hypothetical protein
LATGDFVLRYALPFLLVLSATPTFAQTVDVSGAEALTGSLKRYIGTTVFDQGVVKISVQSDAYRVDVDFNKLLSLFPTESAVKLDVSPYSFSLKPRADSAWDMSGDMAPDGKVEFTVENQTQKTEWKIADDTFSGVYDPALAGFSTATGKFGMLSSVSSDPTSNSEVTIDSGSFELQSTRNPTRGVDFTARQTMNNMVQTMRIASPEAGFELPVVIRTPELSYNSTATGLQAQSLLDLLAFAVANADEAKIKGAQSELKTRLRDALPLWQNLTGAYGLRELSVGTPLGIFSSANLSVTVEMDGVQKDGTIRYGIKLDDLVVPDGVLPRWSAPLLPEDIDLNFGGTGIDLERPATLAIDALDLNRDPPIPMEVSDAITAQFIAEPPKFVIGRSTISNKETEISAEGEMTFAGGKPAASVTLEATGFDKAMEAIQAATARAPEAQQMYLVAVAAKGFAKSLPDGRLQWVVNMTADGAVTVNGAMVKPADPPAPQ